MRIKDPKCFYCNERLKLKKGSKIVYDGLYDKDVKVIVGMNCRKEHYEAKKSTKFGGMYAEFPITKI